MLQLASAGLVRLIPRKGAVVSGISLSEFVATMEVLMELESLAVRLSARRMTIAQRRALEQAARACKVAANAEDPVTYMEANRLFHEAIYDGSRNEVLARELRATRLRTRHPQHAVFERPGQLRNSSAEHRVVLQAILTGDEELAARIMAGHISSGGNVYADSIAAMKEPLAPTGLDAPAAP